MLNVGMTELLCFAIIALLVLGPDKLPEAARFAAKWYAKAKRIISNIQNEIDQSLKLSEFRQEMQKEVERISELERRIQLQIDSLTASNRPESLASEEMSQPPVASLKQHHFKYLMALTTSKTSAYFAPFRPDYIHTHFTLLRSALEELPSSVELKIAV